MAICPNCGSQIPDGVQFCGVCGAPQGAQAQRQPAQQPMQQQPMQQPTYGYRQAAQQGYGAPQQKAPGAFGAKMKGLWQQVTSQPNGQVDFGLLRILSLVFAIGFIFFSLGLGSRIYYNRNIGETLEMYEELKGSKLKTKEINQVKDSLYCTFRLDVKGALKASGMSSSDIKNMTNDQLDEQRDALKENLDNMYEEYGFRLTMMKFGCVYGSWFLWVGLIIALGAAAFWWIKGGRPYNFQQAVILPALIAAAAIFVILFIVNLSVATCVDD